MSTKDRGYKPTSSALIGLRQEQGRKHPICRRPIASEIATSESELEESSDEELTLLEQEELRQFGELVRNGRLM